MIPTDRHPRILVVGGASSDVLRLDTGTFESAGGAGMYTAMAAHRAGATVSLLAPRPDPLPPVLQPVLARLDAWLGPVVAPEDLPHFDISHRNASTEYLVARFGAESTLDPGMLPDDLSAYDMVHVIPLGDAQRQLQFVDACRARNARAMSAGTYLHDVERFPAAVRKVMDRTDVFFMNESEAMALFGSLDAAITATGKVLMVTLGPSGALVLQGSHRTLIPAAAVTAVDPTGAGDSTCGASLAWLARGAHPVIAAQRAMPLAADMIGRVGPAALLADGPAPGPVAGTRVGIDEDQTRRVAALIAALDEVVPFDFVAPELPPPGEPGALDFFFAATLQQFGFWGDDGGRYATPLLAPVGGAVRKGAFYLFEAFRRRQAADPGFCTVERQAAMTDEELLGVFRADDGTDPMPALGLHTAMARAYGGTMVELGLTPATVMAACRASGRPLGTLIALLDRIGGYREDPLRKKSSLLALVLAQRPERFLLPAPGEEPEPVIDYHLMRSCLRTGLVTIADPALSAAIAGRRLVDAPDEWEIRRACFDAVARLVAESGRSVGAVDWFFFGARRRCPEMTEPDCANCVVDPVCAHRRELFQPVIRTTFY